MAFPLHNEQSHIYSHWVRHVATVPLL